MPDSNGDTGYKRLTGRRIIITGAASGIGRAMAGLFRREGAVLALIDRDMNGIESAARELDALPITLDLTDSALLEPTVNSIAGQLGGLDGIVNCAAIGTTGPIEKTDILLLGRFVAVNLVAPYLLCRAALPHLRKEKSATIVNIASGLGLLPNTPMTTAYAATKGGLIAFTKALASEVAPLVRANVVCPGLTDTPMTKFMFEGYNNPSDSPAAKQYALQRVAQPIEIAHAALFLSCEESSYVTGIALAADGGRTFH